MRPIHRCPEVVIDGLRMTEIEDFADYVPEGVTLKPPGTYDAKMTARRGCLCGVDMQATATANGYGVEANGEGRFTFTLTEPSHVCS